MRTSHRSIRLAGALFIPLLLLSCDGGSTGADPVTLAASPGEITVSSGTPTATFMVTTTPAGRLDWQITGAPAWVSLTPSSGRVNRQPVPVTVSANLAGMAPGTHRGRIDLVSSSGTASVDVVATVVPMPVATLSMPALQFAAEVDSMLVQLANTGFGTLHWSTAGLPSWLSVIPTSGSLQTGQSVWLKARVFRGPLPAGVTTGSFTLQTNGAAGALSVPVTVNEPAIARARASVDSFTFAVGVPEQTFVLRNAGKAPLVWTTLATAPWLTATPAGGTVPPGDSAQVRVGVNRAGLTGANAGTLTVRSNAIGGDVSIAVELSAAHPLALLPHGVADAEYNPATGRLVMVTGTPSNALHLRNPEGGSPRSVALPAAPACVSIEPAGRYAAVCHDGAVSYVDLEEMRVVRTYEVSAEALDAVAAGNGYVYVFPRRDQWEYIYSLNLSSGSVALTGTIYAGMVGRLHPSGDYLYGAENHIFPSDFIKVDIRGGRAEILYDSPYHGDYELGGDVWFTEDGTRMFARSGNAFRSSPVRSEDILYAGRLPEPVQSLAHSAEVARVFTIPFFDRDRVSVHDHQLYALRGTTLLPRLPASGEAAVPEGWFLFANGPGTRLFVLLRSPETDQWALAVMETLYMP